MLTDGTLTRSLVGIILVGVSVLVYLNARDSGQPVGSWVAFYISGVIMPLVFTLQLSRQKAGPLSHYLPLIVGWVTIITGLRLID